MTSAELAKPSRKQRVRTLWISDVHLGTRDCQAEHLSQFLKGYQAILGAYDFKSLIFQISLENVEVEHLIIHYQYLGFFSGQVWAPATK